MSQKNKGLVLGALGVVFGDIGTSPLYALKECFNPHSGIALNSSNILGVCSLIFWSITLIIVFKYLMIVLKADNNGEGGTMALLALLKKPQDSKSIRLTVMIALFGTALLYGDGIITPAISVLSAVEGINIITPKFQEYVIPTTVSILLALFLIQKKGTAKIGAFFGPILLVWFSALSVMGLYWIVKNPTILNALNPYMAYEFFIHNGKLAFFLLSSVVLVVTGGEALYADLGHFGRQPIMKAWFYVVYPALILNYFGQGALLLTKGSEAVVNPFFHLVDGWLLYPLVMIATLATIIASQALITGAFSLTEQSIRLGFLPRLKTVYTSRYSQGQIYIPYINYSLMVGCILLVLIMKESSKLASAYGVAVTGTMVVTTLLTYQVAREKWNWSLWKTLPIIIGFLSIDLAFFCSNLIKVPTGGWIALVLSCFIFWVMMTWKKGRLWIAEYINKNSPNLMDFINSIDVSKVGKNQETAIFMTPNKHIAPLSLVNNFKHNNVLHKQIVILNISTAGTPEVPRKDKVLVEKLPNNFYVIMARYGFMETPDTNEILAIAKEIHGFETSLDTTSFFLGKEIINLEGNSKLFYPSKKLFSLLTLNSQPAMAFFKLPPDRVIEIGCQVQM